MCNTKDPQIIMHVFPKHCDLIRGWLQQVLDHFPNMEKWVKKNYAGITADHYRLYTKHFDYIFYHHDGVRRKLCHVALPTIFPSVANTIEASVSTSETLGTVSQSLTDTVEDSNATSMASSTTSNIKANKA